MRSLRRVVVVLLAAAIAYPVWLGYLIWNQSHKDQYHWADAIVVLGAAQYNGSPSPVFKARLDHALYLYRQDLSDAIIVTGGKQPGDRFTEAQAATMYLVERGVPVGSILGENKGRNTLQSLENVWEIADDRGMSTVLLVSDPLHSQRVKTIATDLGFTHAYTSPDSYLDLHRSRLTKLAQLLHEIGSLGLYELYERWTH
jgi:uncharacterized SAM-binding protein YcdF (DUF218 family)